MLILCLRAGCFWDTVGYHFDFMRRDAWFIEPHSGIPYNVSGSPVVISNLLVVEASDDAIGSRHLTHAKEESLSGEGNA